MSLETEILDLLAADSNVTGLVDDRLRFEWPDQNSVRPVLCISRVSGGRNSALAMSNHFKQARVQVDCFGNSYAQTKSLAAFVADALHGYKGAAGSFQIETLSLENEIDLSEHEGDRDNRRVALDFFVIYI